jgi:hypothetical protein
VEHLPPVGRSGRRAPTPLVRMVLSHTPSKASAPLQECDQKTNIPKVQTTAPKAAGQAGQASSSTGPPPAGIPSSFKQPKRRVSTRSFALPGMTSPESFPQAPEPTRKAQVAAAKPVNHPPQPPSPPPQPQQQQQPQPQQQQQQPAASEAVVMTPVPAAASPAPTSVLPVVDKENDSAAAATATAAAAAVAPTAPLSATTAVVPPKAAGPATTSGGWVASFSPPSVASHATAAKKAPKESKKASWVGNFSPPSTVGAKDEESPPPANQSMFLMTFSPGEARREREKKKTKVGGGGGGGVREGEGCLSYNANPVRLLQQTVAHTLPLMFPSSSLVCYYFCQGSSRRSRSYGKSPLRRSQCSLP